MAGNSNLLAFANYIRETSSSVAVSDNEEAEQTSAEDSTQTNGQSQTQIYDQTPTGDGSCTGEATPIYERDATGAGGDAKREPVAFEEQTEVTAEEAVTAEWRAMLRGRLKAIMAPCQKAIAADGADARELQTLLGTVQAGIAKQQLEQAGEALDRLERLLSQPTVTDADYAPSPFVAEEATQAGEETPAEGQYTMGEASYTDGQATDLPYALGEDSPPDEPSQTDVPYALGENSPPDGPSQTAEESQTYSDAVDTNAANLRTRPDRRFDSRTRQMP